MIPGSAEPLLLRTAAAAGGYQIERSIRLNSADSAYLSRTPGSSGDLTQWSWSAWVKLGSLSNGGIFAAGTSDTDYFRIYYFGASGAATLQFVHQIAGSITAQVRTAAVLRDPSAWYHVVYVWDSANGTAADRQRIYINGVRATVTTETTPAQNAQSYGNRNVTHYIGSAQNATLLFNGYLADVHLIDGQALTPSSFGEFDATTGVWNPKAYAGTFTGNSFWLKFSDNSAATATTLGKDYSGLGNNWTPNNLSVSNGVSTIASATGALPILNTDSTGATVQSGVRSDSNASFIRLAVACGTASGLDLTDQNVSGRNASNATITNSGVTGTTSSSKFYSGSANVTNGNYFKVAAHGDFELGGTWTIEFWAKPDSNATGPEKTIIGYGINASDGYVIMVGRGGATFRTNGTSDLVYDGSITDWTHFAFVASGGTTKRIFVNGNLVASGSGTINASGSYDTYIGSPNTFNSGFRFTGEFQDVRFYKGKAKYTASFTAPNTYYPSLAAGNDSLVDSPTNYGTTDTGVGGEIRGNYCTLNPLAVTNLTATPSNGNLETTGNRNSYGTIALPSSGKWYWEVTPTAGTDPMIGMAAYDATTNSAILQTSVFYYVNGNKYITGTGTSYGASYALNDVIGVAVNIDAGTVTFYKNNTSQGAITFNAAGLLPASTTGGGSATYTFNFGQRPFAYTAPSGFKALCTQNLPSPTITNPSTVMDVKLYTGNASTRSITGLGFSPDMVWTKCRSAARAHTIVDIVRGATNELYPNLTSAAGDDGSGLTAFNSDGYSLGNSTTYNANGDTYAAWCWDAGSSNATNTSGTITSTVRANISAGFSIVTWTGGGSGYSVGHGLGVAPKLLIIKDRNNAYDWIVFTTVIDGSLDYLYLNGTDAKADSGGSLPTSTLVYPGQSASSNYVMYCFAPVAGYSSFGSYTGNGSSDGPMVFCNFRPRWLLIKMSSSTGSWYLIDTARLGYNPDNNPLYPNLSVDEQTDDIADILSNGFKIRNSFAGVNTSSGTYIYCAFAESPFQTSRAR